MNDTYTPQDGELVFQYRGWTLVADRSQVFADDPGQGTPLLVTSPTGKTGTLACIIDTCEIDDQPVPGPVLRWLERIADDAEASLYD